MLRQKIEFIESRLQLVVKSAEDMPWYKWALKMMLQAKPRLPSLSIILLFCKNQIRNTALLQHIAERTVNWVLRVENTHTVISDPGD